MRHRADDDAALGGLILVLCLVGAAITLVALVVFAVLMFAGVF